METAMAWTAKTGRRERVLNSIVARLLALADLGEDAANCSPWVRFCVLWSLCQADAVVREFVAGSTWNPAGRLWSPVLPAVRYGTQPADALDLAASLRALALVVLNIAAQRRLSRVRQAEEPAGHEGGPPHDIIENLLVAAISPVELRDTS